MKKFPFFLLVMLLTACSAEKKHSAAPVKTQKGTLFHFSQPWNSVFHLRETENGEILSIGAIYSVGTTVYVYDLAAGSVVLLDSIGTPVRTIQLATIGRNSYMGDDFVVKDSSFIFLNSIDRKLVFFNASDGHIVKSVAIPADLLADAKKRSWRTLSRLFLDNGTLYIGNENHLVPFDFALGKRHASLTTVAAAERERFVLYNKKAPVVARDSLISRRPGKSTYRYPSTHHPISGKRCCIVGNRLYTIDAGKDSVRIVEVK